jgi:hypothetical protein
VSSLLICHILRETVDEPQTCALVLESCAEGEQADASPCRHSSSNLLNAVQAELPTGENRKQLKTPEANPG